MHNGQWSKEETTLENNWACLNDTKCFLSEHQAISQQNVHCKNISEKFKLRMCPKMENYLFGIAKNTHEMRDMA